MKILIYLTYYFYVVHSIEVTMVRKKLCCVGPRILPLSPAIFVSPPKSSSHNFPFRVSHSKPNPSVKEAPMFGRAFRSKYRACYETCRYRDRIDLLASQLSILKYAEQRICVHVREWLRFTKHCADASIDLPSGICAPEVEDYLRQRSPRAGHHRRFVRTALRIFIEADHQGNFPRHIRAQPKPSTEIFTKWVIPYLRFLREHRGLS